MSSMEFETHAFGDVEASGQIVLSRFNISLEVRVIA
jgi:hypothetical protein